MSNKTIIKRTQTVSSSIVQLFTTKSKENIKKKLQLNDGKKVL